MKDRQGASRSESAATLPVTTGSCTVDSHMFLKPGGELRSATSALGRLYSKGEPTLITEEIHTLGHWTDRL